jgi:hypothetical protein
VILVLVVGQEMPQSSLILLYRLALTLSLFSFLSAKAHHVMMISQLWGTVQNRTQALVWCK